MAILLHIETSTALCSAALSAGGRLVAYRETDEPRSHASMTAVLADELMKLMRPDAVCVSKGPGSYTGLRVGVSTAKGLCFGAGIPLIGVGTLEILVWQYLMTAGDVPYKYIIPVIDARRMEVYTEIFRSDGTAATQPEALILGGDSFAPQLEEGQVLFIGDAAGKCSAVITHPSAMFIDTQPRADAMVIPAERAFETGKFEDVAYFEPFYLKNFTTTVSKKSLW